MNNQQHIICVGEILWDALPEGLFLGGAPLNVCLHLHQLGEQVSMLSRVGKDRLGDEAIRRIQTRGVDTSMIQRDGELETGFVKVELDTAGNPEYEIIRPVAWDHITCLPEVEHKAEAAWAIVFGSLAQRSTLSGGTCQSLWQSSALKVFDMNLRKPHFDKQTIRQSLQASDIVKMNEEELDQLRIWFNLQGSTRDAMQKLSDQFECQTICMTRGKNGSILLMDGVFTKHHGYPVQVADAVGAGDAFLAALLKGIKSGKKREELLPFANAAGAFVAMRSGATPKYSAREIEQMIRES